MLIWYSIFLIVVNGFQAAIYVDGAFKKNTYGDKSQWLLCVMT